jgi:O-antigen/teichoic acid export membrane protein
VALVAAVPLARMLPPAEFGLIAMSAVATGFLLLIAEFGLGYALVQAREVRAEVLSTVFWVQAGLGVLLALVAALAAPALAAFYDEPRLVPVAVALAGELAISGLAVTQTALVRRRLDFATLARNEFVATAVSSAAAVAMASAGAGVWSLVARSLLAAALRTIGLWRASGWRPRLVFRPAALRPLLDFSRYLLATENLNYWARNLDTLVLGRIAGVDALGLYNRAYRLFLLPSRTLAKSIHSVLFPSFTQIADDPARVKAIFLRVVRAVALVSFPFHLGLLACADVAVPALFGPAWIAMVPLARVFCLVGLVQSLAGLNGSLYLALGRTDIQLRYGIFLRANVIVGILAGVHWGPLGVAIGYGLASALNFVPSARAAGGLVGLRLVEVWQAVRGALVCALLMSVGVAWSGLAFAASVPGPLLLMTQVSVGAVAYLGLLKAFRVGALDDLIAVLVSPRSVGGEVRGRAG